MIRSTPDNLELLYEDNHIIAVNKRAGDIVQGDQTGDTPLSEVVKAFLKHKYQKPGNVFTGVVHRIDRPVSGAVLFAKTSKALSRLNALFQKKEVRKTYLACVAPAPKDLDCRLEHYLRKDASKNKSTVVRAGRPGAKKAELEYRVLAHGQRYTLLEISPLTGRHHQIRCQLSAIGCPIKGDLKYGAARSNLDGGIHLHAHGLNFRHPVSGLQVVIKAPLPEHDPLWQFFAKAVS